MRRGPFARLIAVALLFSACQRAPEASPATSADAQRTPRVYDVITRDELTEESQLGTTAYLAIQRLRPAYLIDKTAGAASTNYPISVSVNGGQLTGVNTLLGIPSQTIADIRYLDVGNAAQRFHNRATGPVILVTLTTAPTP